ncbi:hypothetical protein CR194_12100 [Salipaludibacillus keqinensis]|uniref:Uncharacterized protein n=1 Tax=Salipaludibacillus keqinensis TaxID=2045207 RepID=A0A323TMH5_9BACI|nr:hypothetical protein [Salipaludibacillus keqinensis]PYZ93873.1 hypothetical protein CR194_12100 [Salipaludibacillus keqinensis]
MKKFISVFFLGVSMIVVLGACSSNEDSADYNHDDYDITLVNTNGEHREVFNEDEKALYLYFTGVD